MSDSLESLVKRIKAGENVSNIVNKTNKEIVSEKSKPSENNRSIANNSFKSLMKNADRLDSYGKYNDIDKPFVEVGTSFLGLVKVLVVLFLGVYLISKW